jgi:hypothetical protein
MASELHLSTPIFKPRGKILFEDVVAHVFGDLMNLAQARLAVVRGDVKCQGKKITKRTLNTVKHFSGPGQVLSLCVRDDDAEVQAPCVLRPVGAVHIIMNKPGGCVTAFKDAHHQTVRHFLEGVQVFGGSCAAWPHLQPVGICVDICG